MLASGGDVFHHQGQRAYGPILLQHSHRLCCTKKNPGIYSLISDCSIHSLVDHDYHTSASNLPFDEISLSASSVSPPALQPTLKFHNVELTGVTATQRRSRNVFLGVLNRGAAALL